MLQILKKCRYFHVARYCTEINATVTEHFSLVVGDELLGHLQSQKKRKEKGGKNGREKEGG